MSIYNTESEQETAAVAASVARAARAGDIFLLEGPLGAGKSVFARGFIRALCGEKTEVPSPTFTLVQTYETAHAPLYHFDLYRLQNPDEIFELGWDEARSHGILLVEWPSRLGPYIPRGATTIRIEPILPETRKITIDA